MSYCGGEDGGIEYVKFANFLNWKDKMPIVFSASETKSAMDDKSKPGMLCLNHANYQPISESLPHQTTRLFTKFFFPFGSG